MKKEEEQKKKQNEQETLEYLRMLSAYLLEPDAYSRLLLIKAKNPSLFSSIMQTLLYLYQNKKILKKINEKELLDIAGKIIESGKSVKEGKIVIKRKGE